jgi:hypothetical protein
VCSCIGGFTGDTCQLIPCTSSTCQTTGAPLPTLSPPSLTSLPRCSLLSPTLLLSWPRSDLHLHYPSVNQGPCDHPHCPFRSHSGSFQQEGWRQCIGLFSDCLGGPTVSQGVLRPKTCSLNNLCQTCVAKTSIECGSSASTTLVQTRDLLVAGSWSMTVRLSFVSSLKNENTIFSFFFSFFLSFSRY